MKPVILFAMSLGLVACNDAMNASSDFPEDVQACREAMAFREQTTPTFIEVISASALRDGSGVQVFLTHNGENMTLCRTDTAQEVTSIYPYG